VEPDHVTNQPPAQALPVDPSWPPPYPEQVDTAADLKEAFVATLKDVAVIVGGMAVLGVVCGALWALVVEPAQLIRFDNGVGQDELQLGRVFDADGWFATIAAAAGLVAGLVFGFWRRRNLLTTVLLAMVGCVVAGLLMWKVGVALGPDDPAAMLQQAPVGTHADAPLHRPEWPIFLAWPISALVGLLIALVSRTD